MPVSPGRARHGVQFAVAAIVVASWSFAVVPPVRATSTIVISQVYGGGGESGSDYKRDFIELFNGGAVSIDLAGWTVQYASATGSTWERTSLAGTIAAYGHYLIGEGTGAGGSVDLPTPNANGAIAMSATAGKVALVAGDALLSGTCDAGLNLVDLVGYGAADCVRGRPCPNPIEHDGGDARGRRLPGHGQQRGRFLHD